MGTSSGSDGSGNDHRYGPELNQYLRTGCLDLSQREPPTQDEAIEAIEALRNLDATYEDFETILSMEKSPACLNLCLLLSTPDDDFIGIFPACVGLLRIYCNAEGNGVGLVLNLLDTSFDFLVCTLTVFYAFELCRS
ncbi:unnamed protein product [Rhizoctonia solani]|uniref:Uncharacterized protein n=1 Tax=Rhizoctonia solani TaxID=456999 RepID=A0A8H3GAQ5_9AGAM|nr:unnamed protein product [Rhizoctonia solani]